MQPFGRLFDKRTGQRLATIMVSITAEPAPLTTTSHVVAKKQLLPLLRRSCRPTARASIATEQPPAATSVCIAAGPPAATTIAPIVFGKPPLAVLISIAGDRPPLAAILFA